MKLVFDLSSFNVISLDIIFKFSVTKFNNVQCIQKLDLTSKHCVQKIGPNIKSSELSEFWYFHVKLAYRNIAVLWRVFYCLTNSSHWIVDIFSLFTFGKSLWHGITSEGIEFVMKFSIFWSFLHRKVNDDRIQSYWSGQNSQTTPLSDLVWFS